MFKDKTERYIIQKMGELAKQYQEPYDDRDMEAHKNNAPLKEKYDFYREILKDLCNF